MAADSSISSIAAHQAAPAHTHRKSGHGRLSRSQKPNPAHGLALAVIIGLAALGMGRWFPIIGGPVFGILFGIAIRNSVGVGPIFRPGLQFASKQILQWSIIALGFSLSIQQVAQTGMESLSVTFVTIAVAFGSAFLLGKCLNIPSKMQTLIDEIA